MPGICMKTENDIVNKVGKMRFYTPEMIDALEEELLSTNKCPSLD